MNARGFFQDRKSLYLVMDLLKGGDLRFHLCCVETFQETEVKFIAGCILLGLRYIHKNNMIHRDIKPENLVFDEEGYVRITDFGIARKLGGSNKEETSGTPGYMAPEVIFRQEHGLEVDYFAFGVICFECMLGRRPYVGKNRAEIRNAILSKQVQISDDELPKGWTKQAQNFINLLIQRRVERRIGTNGIDEIFNHPWFKGFDWNMLDSKKMKAPFRPNVKAVFEYLHYAESTSQTENQSSILHERATTGRRLSDAYFKEIFQSYELMPATLKMVRQNQLNEEKTTKEKPRESSTILVKSLQNFKSVEQKKLANINLNIFNQKNENKAAGTTPNLEYQLYKNVSLAKWSKMIKKHIEIR